MHVAKSKDSSSSQWLVSQNPILQSIRESGINDDLNMAKVYICESGSCSLPLRKSDDVQELLNSRSWSVSRDIKESPELPSFTKITECESGLCSLTY